MVVVTGAAGHVGANLVRSLLSSGRRVRVLVYQDRRALEGLDVEFVNGDVRDLESLRRAFEKAEVVYHAAAHISLLANQWPIMESINVIGTRNVVDACLDCGVNRLIHFSSIHALNQEPFDVPVDESRSFVSSQRSSPYNRSKAEAEKEVLKGIKRGLDSIILNPTGVIGPFDFKPSHCGEALLTMSRGKLPVLVKGGFDWVDVRDVVKGALTAEQQAPTGFKYILSGNWVSVCDVAATVEQVTGVQAPQFVSPSWLARMGAPFVTTFAQWKGKRPLYTRFSLKSLHDNRQISHAKATRELNYHPRPFRETIVDTLRWFARNGYLSHIS